MDGGDLVFNNWFCPKTVTNLRDNSSIVVALWGKEEIGYQVEGKKTELKEVATLDGFSPGVEETDYPQSKYRLRISVSEIYEFSPGPHSDQPIQDFES